MDNRFCIYCGHDLSKPSIQGDEPPRQEISRQPEHEVASKPPSMRPASEKELRFCTSCGKEVGEGDLFCPTCGHNLATNPSLPPIDNEQMTAMSPVTEVASINDYKSVGTATVLGVVLGLFGLFGVGQIYVGQVGKGIGIMLTNFVIIAITIIILFQATAIFFLEAISGSVGSAASGFTIFALLLILIMDVGFYIWQAYDAYDQAREYNISLQANGRPPW